MTNQQFLQQFGHFIEAPNGIQKLRELILQLAVQGKLVEQDPNDEPASELLKRIQADKEKLVSEGKFKMPKTLPSLSEDEFPFILPNGWNYARLGDLVRIINGRAYKRHEMLESGTPLLRVGNLFTSNEWYYSDLELEDDKYCDEGDLIYAWSASFGPFIWNGPKVIYHYHIWKLGFYNDKFLYKNYLYTFLQEKTQEIKASGHGISMAHMTKEKMEKLVVPVPPLPEQHRIVAKVDELMSLCDQLEAERNAREATHQRLIRAVHHPLTEATDTTTGIDNLTAWHRIRDNFADLYTTLESVQALRQTILQLAVQGKLVAQDANDDPASNLLEKIRLLKETLIDDGRLKKNRPAQKIEDSELPFSVPIGWEWVRFGDATVCRDGERIPISRDMRENRKGNYDYYGASGVIDQIDDYIFDKALLLIGEDGANLINRSTPIAFIAKGNYWVNNHAHVLDGISEQYLEYLCLYINAIDLKPYVTGTAQPKMNQAKMNSILVALPPEREQHRIVVKVDELMAICDQLQSNIRAKRDTAARYVEAIVEQIAVA